MAKLEITEMMALKHNGESLQSIGDKAGISRQRVHQILNGNPDYNPASRREYNRNYQRKKFGYTRKYKTKFNPEAK